MIIRPLPRPVMALDRASRPVVDGMAFMALALDRASASVRTKDRNGFLHIAVSNISKAGVDPYYGEEIPNWEKLGLDPKKIYQLLRDPGELETAAQTFNNLPVLSEHIPVTAAAPQKDATVGSTGTDAVFADPYLQNSAVITDQDAIDDIEDKIKKEWSCGYFYTADMTPGVYKGLRYDGVMRNIHGNHVALVDAGRAGPDVVVGDQMPRGLQMVKITSRAALMLNGALAAAIGPMLAQDKRLDLSGVLSGVNAKNMGKSPAKLADKIVKLAAPKLAQDAELDADDVCKVIAAINGSVAEMPAAEDDIPDDAPMTADADGDIVSKIMAFLAGKLSDEDMAAVGALATPGATDEFPDDDDGKDKDKDKEKPAMDRATTAKLVAMTVAELRTAEREVAPIIGEIKIACDSAAAVYKLALDHAKVDTTGVHPSAFRSMVAMLAKNASAAPAPAIALDRRTVQDDFNSRFPNATKLVAL